MTNETETPDYNAANRQELTPEEVVRQTSRPRDHEAAIRRAINLTTSEHGREAHEALDALLVEIEQLRRLEQHSAASQSSFTIRTVPASLGHGRR